ncbi:uncharacterized protein MELLADRAFT_89813 [Melampsora larici-populina 98AG31]|uniref:Uncharacterized protein n=1 Tax=Melampsora larici-populina (strain 98AG31 / pathotype 3-4-7) TaxID=747676 RepID=F4RUQ4_MELLP|nr:uncharacterized protein MELLADRAFT_89813 [Melampsora larici-populina 98AG31]EGG03737.1 hypothetical protein MELLADRAFT_89813 [Melampsora larici-populina 98AG31]
MPTHDLPFGGGRPNASDDENDLHNKPDIYRGPDISSFVENIQRAAIKQDLIRPSLDKVSAPPIVVKKGPAKRQPAKKAIAAPTKKGAAVTSKKSTVVDAGETVTVRKPTKRNPPQKAKVEAKARNSKWKGWALVEEQPPSIEEADVSEVNATGKRRRRV